MQTTTTYQRRSILFNFTFVYVIPYAVWIVNGTFVCSFYRQLCCCCNRLINCGFHLRVNFRCAQNKCIQNYDNTNANNNQSQKCQRFRFGFDFCDCFSISNVISIEFKSSFPQKISNLFQMRFHERIFEK